MKEIHCMDCNTLMVKLLHWKKEVKATSGLLCTSCGRKRIEKLKMK